MEPIGVYSTIIKSFIGRPLQLISFNFTDPYFKVSLMTIVATIYCLVFPIFVVTTCFETDTSQCMQSVVMGVVATQCSAVTYITILNHAGLLKNIKLITKLYEVNKSYGENKDDLRKAARINLSLAKLLAFGISATTLVLATFPIPVYVFTGQIVPIMPVKIPFVTTDTLFGYTLHLVFHLFAAYNGGLGLIGTDTYMITMTIHIWPLIRILERSVLNLNLATKSIEGDKVKDSVWLKLQMRNIILMHKEIYFFVRGALDMSYALSTAELYTDQAAMVVLVYCILKLKWIPGILLFFCALFKLFAFCMIGTVMDYFNDKTYYALANIDCTMLPEAEKKNVMIMLHVAQHPPTMKAGLVQMNLMLFVEVVKGIYTIGMLLMESL